jgi:hypothetical protein
VSAAIMAALPNARALSEQSMSFPRTNLWLHPSAADRSTPAGAVSSLQITPTLRSGF